MFRVTNHRGCKDLKIVSQTIFPFTIHLYPQHVTGNRTCSSDTTRKSRRTNTTATGSFNRQTTLLPIQGIKELQEHYTGCRDASHSPRQIYYDISGCNEVEPRFVVEWILPESIQLV